MLIPQVRGDFEEEEGHFEDPGILQQRGCWRSECQARGSRAVVSSCCSRAEHSRSAEPGPGRQQEAASSLAGCCWRGLKLVSLPHGHTHARSESNCCHSQHWAWVQRRKHDFLPPLVERPGTAKTNCGECSASPTTRCGVWARQGCEGLWGHCCLPTAWEGRNFPVQRSQCWAREGKPRHRKAALSQLQPVCFLLC